VCVCVCVYIKDLFIRDMSLWLVLQEICEELYFDDYCKVQCSLHIIAGKCSVKCVHIVNL
jgi:hypothetical protein